MLEAWKSECLYSFFLSFLFIWGGGEGSVEFIIMNLILGGYILWVYQNFIELLGWKEIEIGDGLPNIRMTGKCKLVLRWAIFPILFCFLFLPFWIFVMICTSDNVFIYSAKGHVREWSCNGLTYPLVLAFR